ncbi:MULTISPECIES: FAD-dependent monooxygenase [Streptomyces]|uniref:FAD-dependent oxidoreductase n=2 Tax=Streptomyces TaxID=1883 RepID=A0A3R7EK68_9ACTN|nr:MULTISPECIES: FAD-dependent monooxygenase [Streptomyces]KNE83022.1 FAD-dependent oxidoreductase [Streptomyces fradiae]OFA52865.1 FAD-dependent oxidoreductase [Streptomyces fradiae]PQM20447.1 FAD-dependent oxidoreductase [Streptomyces xinghaiensis]RKM91258.1 FAD-dependent oxidoreductase [Streptomyces xinghaiensis]RNC69751.1 FAD-dependent oxidoreductase [Streptomyces xinghaiensis]
MKALICGAGIAGLALAARLLDHGWDVHLVDKAPGPRGQGYMIDFFGPGFEALTAMGLQPRLRQLGHPATEFCYVDGEGRRVAGVDYDRFRKATGGGLVSIMRPDLELLLREAVADRAVLQYGTTVEQVAEDSGSVTLSDGARTTADLVVGADGIHSRIRSLVFGPERDHVRYLGMHTGAFVFEDEEVFRRMRDRFALTDTLHRQMGFYGLSDGRVAVFTVHRTRDPALPADPREALRREFGGMGRLVRRALDRCPPGAEVYYDQVAQIDAPRWRSGRVVLLGDAAHAVSLIAGQGASLGVAGAYVLAERLRAAGAAPSAGAAGSAAPAGSVAAALAGYEERWRPVAGEVQARARQRVGEWFLPASPSRLLLRRWGFRAMRVPGLDRLLTGALFPTSRSTVARLSE